MLPFFYFQMSSLILNFSNLLTPFLSQLTIGSVIALVRAPLIPALSAEFSLVVSLRTVADAIACEVGEDAGVSVVDRATAEHALASAVRDDRAVDDVLLTHVCPLAVRLKTRALLNFGIWVV